MVFIFPLAKDTLAVIFLWHITTEERNVACSMEIN